LADGGRIGHGDKPRANAYTVLLILALLAMLVGCLFLVLEIKFQKQGEGFFSPVRPVVMRWGVSPEGGSGHGRRARVVGAYPQCGEAPLERLACRLTAAGVASIPTTGVIRMPSEGAPPINGVYVQLPAIVRTHGTVRNERKGSMSTTWIGSCCYDRSASDC